ncbi:MAG: triose-phosphate isomerase [Thaumarchaeota archaeon]|nr:MAG: triose-phosphate isomerase [Thaumarchaeota archaeon 13_1_40CM_4_38_7]OLD29613.1 MAG: triose-phosphate isomerase [Thaumarchaeota archaeon 13_1_40CM_2_39_7]TLY05258.1 MAG: triose-phosphate isomerase [Nitrososphaerota archaeon]TLY07140.1 MAG: triose-phosphate isomerase [Nitrososphaerota archaeon]
MFIINFKNYDNISGSKSLKLAKIATKISRKYKIKIAVCPPQNVLSEVTKTSIPVFAQHVDTAKAGSTTGYIVPELVRKSGASGSLINHSEHRISSKEIKELVSRLKRLNMISVICVRNVDEARRYSKLNPNYIAIEPPELIGTGKAVSKEKPEIITKSVKAVKEAKNSTRLLCGAGIISGDDVSRALELGARGILVASGIVKARNWERAIDEFALSFKNRKV